MDIDDVCYSVPECRYRQCSSDNENREFLDSDDRTYQEKHSGCQEKTGEPGKSSGLDIGLSMNCGSPSSTHRRTTHESGSWCFSDHASMTSRSSCVNLTPTIFDSVFSSVFAITAFLLICGYNVYAKTKPLSNVFLRKIAINGINLFYAT